MQVTQRQRDAVDRRRHSRQAPAATNATSGQTPTRCRKRRDTPRASTSDLADLQPRQERRGHPVAVALEELDQVEVRADRDDQVGALLVGEQHREVLADPGRGDEHRRQPEPVEPRRVRARRRPS